MSKHRHHGKHKAKGGRVAYDAQGSHVEHEAEEKKHGGAVHHMGHAHGHKGKHRIKKARGGGIGSDKSPFSSAGRGGMSDHPADHSTGHAHGGGAFVGAHGKK
jgi:hypothetical protein